MWRQSVWKKLASTLRKPVIAGATQSLQGTTQFHTQRAVVRTHGINKLLLRSAFSTATKAQATTLPGAININNDHFQLMPHHVQAAEVIQRSLAERQKRAAKLAARDLITTLQIEQQRARNDAGASSANDQHEDDVHEVAAWIPPEISRLLVSAFLMSKSLDDLLRILESFVTFKGDYVVALSQILQVYHPLLLADPANEQYTVVTFQALKAMEFQGCSWANWMGKMDVLALYLLDDQIGGLCWQEFTQLFHQVGATESKEQQLELFERYVTLLVKQNARTGYQLIEKLLPIAEEAQLFGSRPEFFTVLLKEFGCAGSFLDQQTIEIHESEQSLKLREQQQLLLDKQDRLASQVMEIVDAMQLLEIPLDKHQFALFTKVFPGAKESSRLWLLDKYQQLNQIHETAHDHAHGFDWHPNHIRNVLLCCRWTDKWQLAEQILADWQRLRPQEPVPNAWKMILARIMIDNQQTDKACELVMQFLLAKKGEVDPLFYQLLGHYARMQTEDAVVQYNRLFRAFCAFPEANFHAFRPLIHELLDANRLDQALEAWASMEQKLTPRTLRRLKSANHIINELAQLLDKLVMVASQQDQSLGQQMVQFRQSFLAKIGAKSGMIRTNNSKSSMHYNTKQRAASNRKQPRHQ